MNTRSITLGASVIVIALAGPGSAQAGTLGELGTGLPETNVAVKVQTEVKANADVPVKLPSKGSPARVQHKESADTTVKGGARANGSAARVGLNGGVAGTHGRLGENVRVKAIAPGHVAKGGVTASSRSSATIAADHHHGRLPAKAKARHSNQARPRTLGKPHWSAPTGGHKDIVPLRGIGREVGNPIQLGLAGWLIALTGAACFGASRFVRRVQRSTRL